MSGKIVSQWRYPLKGAGGQERTLLEINPRVGVVGDRVYGLKKDPERPNVWMPKAAFHVCMNEPRMAIEHPRYGIDGDPVPTLDRDYVHGLGDRLGLDHAPSVVATHGQYSLTDSTTPYVSILNLATVRALSKFAGADIDPRRFRMNVWVDDFEPLEEQLWVNSFPGTRFIEVGDQKLRIDDACERCRAIEANPETGVRDLDLRKIIDSFMAEQGYPGSPHRDTLTVMGVLAAPCSKGTISVGDEIRFLS